MVMWSYPPTARQMAVTGGVFVIGASFVGVGAYLSFVNVAPQQARAKARSEAMRAYLRKRFGSSSRGKSGVAVYDGSLTEGGADSDDIPVETSQTQ